MGGLCKEGHEFLKIMIDVLVTQHSKWTARRVRRALLGQSLVDFERGIFPPRSGAVSTGELADKTPAATSTDTSVPRPVVKMRGGGLCMFVSV